MKLTINYGVSTITVEDDEKESSITITQGEGVSGAFATISLSGKHRRVLVAFFAALAGVDK